MKEEFDIVLFRATLANCAALQMITGPQTITGSRKITGLQMITGSQIITGPQMITGAQMIPLKSEMVWLLTAQP